MNEPQFVEAARALAERTIREGGSAPEARHRAAVPPGHRPARPRPAELAELLAAYQDFLAELPAGTPRPPRN